MGNAAPAMRGDAPPVYVNTEHAARVLGLSPATVRRRAEGGEIPGATRIGARGSAWRFPLAALLALTSAAGPMQLSARIPAPLASSSVTSTSRSTGYAERDVSADPLRDDPDVTSTSRAPLDLIDTAARVVHTLSAVTTRPATALSSVMPTLAAAAMRHSADPDGRCAACRWPSYPCPDAELYAAVVGRVASVVLSDGE